MPTDWAEFTPETTDWSEFTPEETTKSPGYLGPSWPAQEGEEAPQAPLSATAPVSKIPDWMQGGNTPPISPFGGTIGGIPELLKQQPGFIQQPFKAIPSAPTIEETPVQDWESKLLYTAPGLKALSALTGEDTAVQTLREIYNQAKSLPEFVETPMGVMALAGAKLAPRTVAGAFGIETAINAVKQGISTIRDWDTMTSPQKARSLVQLVGMGTLGALLGKAALAKPIPPRIQEAITKAEPILPQAAQAVKETKGAEYATEKGLQPSDVREQRTGDDQGRAPQGPSIGGGLQPATPSAAAEAPRPAQGQAGVLLGKEPLILAGKRTPEGEIVVAREHRTFEQEQTPGESGYLVVPESVDPMLFENDLVRFTAEQAQKEGIRFVSIPEAQAAKGDIVAAALKPKVVELTPEQKLAEQRALDEALGQETTPTGQLYYAAGKTTSRGGIQYLSETEDLAKQYAEGGKYGRPKAEVKSYRADLKIFDGSKASPEEQLLILGKKNLVGVEPDGNINFNYFESDPSIAQRLRENGYDAIRVSEGIENGTSIAVLPSSQAKIERTEPALPPKGTPTMPSAAEPSIPTPELPAAPGAKPLAQVPISEATTPSQITQEPFLGKTKAEEPPLPPKFQQKAITSALKAIDIILSPKATKHPMESALMRLRSAGNKLGIPVPRAGTYFSPDLYRKIAGEAQVAIGKRFGTHPTEEMRAARDKVVEAQEAGPTRMDEWPWPEQSQWAIGRLRRITPEERAKRSQFLGLKTSEGAWETSPKRIADAAKARFEAKAREKAAPPAPTATVESAPSGTGNVLARKIWSSEMLKAIEEGQREYQNIKRDPSAPDSEFLKSRKMVLVTALINRLKLGTQAAIKEVDNLIAGKPSIVQDLMDGKPVSISKQGAAFIPNSTMLNLGYEKSGRMWQRPSPPMPPGPGAASPAEFAQRQAGQGAKPPLPPPPNPPIAIDASELPTPDKFRQPKDYTPFNRLNSGQWNFYFGRYGGAAKAAWERMTLGEFKMRESIARDVQDYVLRPLKALPRPLRKQGGKAFYEILDGKKMEDIRKEWENKPDGDVVIAQAEGIRTRLEEIRTTIRDLKRDSYTRALSGMNKDALIELFQKNVSDKVDISAYTKDDLANGLVREAYPDDWGIADGSYLPHLFFGHWKVSVFAPGMEKPQFVTRAQTAHEADVAVFKLVKQNPELKDAHFTIEEDTVVPADMIRLGDRKFWRMIMEMKDQAQGAIDPKQAVQGIIGRKSTKQKWFGSLQHRIGLEGYSKDYRRVMSAYLSGFHRWKELTAINREVQPLIEQTARDKHGQAAQRLTDIFDNLWGKPTRLTIQFDNLLRRIPGIRDYVKPLALDRWARNAATITTNLMLRTARFMLAVNRLQPLQGLYPMVGERIMAQAKIRQHTKEGRALLDEAGVTFDPGQYSAEGLGGKFTRSMERLSGEQSNQELAFLAMYQHGIERGLAKPEAIKYAKLRGQLLTQFTPMITDMPELFEGPVGRVLFQFKRFPVKQVELMAHMAGQRQFGGLARMLLMFGAIGGTSFFLRQFFVDPEKRLRFKRALDEQFGEKTADGIMYGLPGLLGADISGSIVLGEEPWGANIYEKAGRQLAGPTISMGIEAVRGIRKEAREPISEWERALAVMRRIPSLRQIAEVESLLSGDLDVMTPEGERKFRRTVTDALMGLGAFKSANEANLQVAVNGILEVQKERKAIMNRYFVASLQGSDGVGKAVKEVMGFNERWPEYAITSENMSRYRDYRQRNIGKTDVERAVPKQLLHLLPAAQR